MLWQTLTDCGGSTGNGRLGALVEIVHRHGASEFQLEVCMWIDTTGNNHFSGGIYRAAASRDDEVCTGANVSRTGRRKQKRIFIAQDDKVTQIIYMCVCSDSGHSANAQ